MQKFTQKYTIISLLEDIYEGYDYAADNWPLHVTLVDTFAISWSVETLKEELKILAQELQPLLSTAIKDQYFGEEKSVHVVLLDKTDELKAFHQRIVDQLKGGGLVLNNPEFSENGFLPHSTVQKHLRVDVGDTVQLTNIALVDMFPGQDPYRRKILQIINLV